MTSIINPRFSVREKLCTMLCQEGFALHEGDLKPVSGYWKKMDVYRWESVVKTGVDEGSGLGGRTVLVVSWDTMTECVRNGIEVVEKNPYSFEVHAKEKSTPTV